MDLKKVSIDACHFQDNNLVLIVFTMSKSEENKDMQ